MSALGNKFTEFVGLYGNSITAGWCHALEDGAEYPVVSVRSSIPDHFTNKARTLHTVAQPRADGGFQKLSTFPIEVSRVTASSISPSGRFLATFRASDTDANAVLIEVSNFQLVCAAVLLQGLVPCVV